MDSSFLKPLYDAHGPWCSVYLAAAPDEPSPGRAIDANWRDLRGRLAELGADERDLRAVDTEVAADATGGQDGGPGPHGRALFAAGGSVALQRELRVPAGVSRAVFGELPDVLPLLAQTPDFASYLLVFAKRGGADVEVHEGPESQPGNEPAGEKRRGAAGAIAAAAERIADEHSAGMIAVTGDARARANVLEKLDPQWRERAVELDGTAAADPDPGAVRRQAADAAAGFQREWRSALVERYADGLTDGTAVNGLEATVGSLRAGDVETLLVRHGLPEARAAVWWGEAPELLAGRPEELDGPQAAQIRRGRAADVLVRATTLEGGDLVLLSDNEPGPSDAVGAILRHTPRHGVA